jgi:CheY-like chemotaxis protein
MSMIMSSSRLLQSIVDDVLDYSKLQSGNLELQVQRTDIQEVVSKLVLSMRASSLVRKRNVTIQPHFHPSVSRYIKADGRKLLQILFNLVSNAAKFSKDDGVVEINLEICDAPETEIEECDQEREKKPLVSFALDKKQVLRFRIKDFGKGIEERHFDSIFKPFAQTNSGINNIDGGTGLGLAITEKLVKALGGSISVNSIVEEWTEFMVDLPVDETLPTIDSMSSSLRAADFFFVGELEEDATCKKLEEIFGCFKMNLIAVSNADELERKLQERTSVPPPMTYCFCKFPQFDESSFRKVSDEYKLRLITLGHGSKPEGAVANYQALDEIVPSSLLQDLRDLVEHHLESPNDAMGTSERKSNEEDIRSLLSVLRVLIAEDNLVNQKILVRMLKRLGVENVEVVGDGQKAVDREAVTPFDIVLMDMQMPVMGGVDAAVHIMERQGGHRTPLVIFVTAHVSPSFEATCYESGAVAYLTKPYTVDELKTTLHSAVSRT